MGHKKTMCNVPDVLDKLGDDFCVGLGFELVPLAHQEHLDVLVVRDDAVVNN
jgi:hypothetical protein